MRRMLLLTVSVAVGAAGLSAGTVFTQVGGPNGITASYITSNGGSQGGWVEKNYNSYLFNGVSTGTAPGTNYNYQYTGTPPNSTITDANGVTFSMLNDGCGGTSGGAPVASPCGGQRTNNVWVASQTGAPSTMVIPVGIFGANDVFTMLNNEYGLSGAQDTTIEFDFGSSATNANGPSLVLDLTNSSNSTGNTGQIRTGTTSSNGTCFSCADLANGSTASTSTVNGVTILTNRIFNQSYSSQLTAPLAGTPFYGSTAGMVILNDQQFILPTAYSSYYLVDVKVTEDSGVAGGSQTVISGITVESTTPEPSAIWLGLTGLVAIAGVSIYRRKVSA